ncbi:FAD-dependent oxidoreductase [Jatrophihabitans sp.]|uniref:FAD-dependent oxidoreductase n=1 Tax=Jatrophihabitans sp. TaxID=1932789 RepID=UPI002D08C298|nr:FAD-dependent oxidoreductase [Jatrophihabitans sp.]
MRVRVVGAGIVGLTSALRLAEAGHRVEVVAADLLEATTSAVAAALWYPYRATPTAQVIGWLHASFADLAELAAEPGTGVRLLAGRELFAEPAADPWWRSTVPDLARIPGDRLPAGYRDGYRLTVPVVDMAVHLAWLSDRLRAGGGAVAAGRLADLTAALDGVDVAVNCTGLGARELAGDATLSPVRGQIVVVEQFGLAEWLLDQADPVRLTYLVPRGDTVILGGTAEEGDAGLEVRPATAEAILARCAALVPAAAGARILGHRVGLRPARPAVRLEAEGPVVHCYGHGGAGVTLAYGCAREVVRQVGLLD